MKRKLFVISMVMAALMPFCSLRAYSSMIQVQLNITDPEDDQDPRKREPILVPVLYLDGYTLTASDYTVGSTIQLLDENDNVVFSTYVAIEGDIQLPANLSGTYTIRVTRGSQTFVGDITL